MTRIHLHTLTLPGHRAPGAGYEAPFEMLDACHERVERMLRLLHKLRAHLQASGWDAQAAEAARDVLRYFNEAAPRHHEDEERHVFPAVLAAPDAPALPHPGQGTSNATNSGQGNGGGTGTNNSGIDKGTSLHAVVHRLLQDHADMQTRWASARPVLERIARPATGPWQPLGTAEEAALDAFSSLYASHIEAENHLIYPAAQQALTPAQLQAMSADMMARRGVVLPAAAATPAASGPSFTA
jgi:hemerythrin-like domain-containing protein